ncbi:MAG: hypothetical protein IPK77_10375 [Cellvibrio sp.]|nr:hypothetical protein [Cellvibrio sp.]
MKILSLIFLLALSGLAMSDSCRWSGSVSLLDQQYEFAFIGKIEND